VERFLPLDQFRQRVDEIIDLMHSCPRAPGVERIFVPGEIEVETERRRRAEGIPISGTLKEELRALGNQLSVPPPF
jgi:LDH2 family malate/lactate/ureidoglycolate dehydrogenase